MKVLGYAYKLNSETAMDVIEIYTAKGLYKTIKQVKEEINRDRQSGYLKSNQKVKIVKLIMEEINSTYSDLIRHVSMVTIGILIES